MKSPAYTLARKLAILTVLSVSLAFVSGGQADNGAVCCSTCNSEYIECVEACTDPETYDQCYYSCELEYMGCICCCDNC